MREETTFIERTASDKGEKSEGCSSGEGIDATIGLVSERVRCSRPSIHTGVKERTSNHTPRCQFSHRDKVAGGAVYVNPMACRGCWGVRAGTPAGVGRVVARRAQPSFGGMFRLSSDYRREYASMENGVYSA